MGKALLGEFRLGDGGDRRTAGVEVDRVVGDADAVGVEVGPRSQGGIVHRDLVGEDGQGIKPGEGGSHLAVGGGIEAIAIDFAPEGIAGEIHLAHGEPVRVAPTRTPDRPAALANVGIFGQTMPGAHRRIGAGKQAQEWFRLFAIVIEFGVGGARH